MALRMLYNLAFEMAEPPRPLQDTIQNKPACQRVLCGVLQTPHKCQIASPACSRRCLTTPRYFFSKAQLAIPILATTTKKVCCIRAFQHPEPHQPQTLSHWQSRACSEAAAPQGRRPRCRTPPAAPASVAPSARWPLRLPQRGRRLPRSIGT